MSHLAVIWRLHHKVDRVLPFRKQILDDIEKRHEHGCGEITEKIKKNRALDGEMIRIGNGLLQAASHGSYMPQKLLHLKFGDHMEAKKILKDLEIFRPNSPFLFLYCPPWIPGSCILWCCTKCESITLLETK